MDQHKDSGKADIVAMKALVMTLQGKKLDLDTEIKIFVNNLKVYYVPNSLLSHLNSRESKSD